MWAHLVAIGCNGQEILRVHLATIGCNGLNLVFASNGNACQKVRVRSDIAIGGFRNLERGVQLLAREAQPKILGMPRPLPVT